MTSIKNWAVGEFQARRLSLAWLAPVERRWARAGLIGYTAAGVGVAAAAFGGPPRIAATMFGPLPVVSLWVPLTVYLLMAVAAAALLRAPTIPTWRRLAVGSLLAYVSIGFIESIRPIQAPLGSLGPTFTMGRVLAWIALAAGSAVLTAGAGETRSRVSWLAGSGFVLVLTAQLTVTAGAAGTLPDQVGAILTQGLQNWAIPLSSGLLFFVAWQLIEGMHASEDLGATAMRRLTGQRLRDALLAKLLLVTVAAFFLLPGAKSEWVTARSARPIAWAFAGVVAAAIVFALTRDGDLTLDRQSASRAAVAVIALWAAPYLVGLVTVGFGWAALILLPSSPGDMIALAFVVVAGVLMRKWAIGATNSDWQWKGLALAGIVTVSLIGPTSSRWLADQEAAIVSALGRLSDGAIEIAMPWAAWSLSLLPLVAAGWMLFRRQTTSMAMSLVIVGIALLPRAVGVLGREVLGVDIPLGLSANVLMLDFALTLAVLWQVLVASRRRALRPESVYGLGVAVAVTTIVAYGSQIGGLVVDGLSWIVSAAPNVESGSIALMMPLILPAAYAVLLDSKPINTERSLDGVFTLLAMGSVLLVLALVSVALGGFDAATSDNELLGVLILPGLTVLTALIAAGRTNSPGANSIEVDR